MVAQRSLSILETDTDNLLMVAQRSLSILETDTDNLLMVAQRSLCMLRTKPVSYEPFAMSACVR